MVLLIVREKCPRETLDYQNQGIGGNVGWCRPKECEAVGIIARIDRTRTQLMFGLLWVGVEMYRDAPRSRPADDVSRCSCRVQQIDRLRRIWVRAALSSACAVVCGREARLEEGG
jgi:hypothetical protein